MRTIKEVEKELLILEENFNKIKGTETEVYTRIVGYHRAVTNWNKGKREEYKDRVTFRFDNKKMGSSRQTENISSEKSLEEKQKEIATDNVAFYKFFYSQVCRNCPPVKDYVKNLTIPGEDVDVTTDLGLNSARLYNVLSTPAVVLLDQNKKVIQTANTVEELKRVFS
jgi:hypothetical protein